MIIGRPPVSSASSLSRVARPTVGGAGSSAPSTLSAALTTCPWSRTSCLPGVPPDAPGEQGGPDAGRAQPGAVQPAGQDNVLLTRFLAVDEFAAR